MADQNDRLNREIKVPLTTKIANVSTSGSVFVASPVRGRLASVHAVPQTTITSGSAALTFEIGGVAVGGASISLASGAVAGTVESALTLTSGVSLSEGQAVEVITDGGSDTASVVDVTLGIVPAN